MQATFDAFDGGNVEETTDDGDDVDVHISVLENDLAFIESAKAVGITAEPNFAHSEYRRVWDN